MKGITYLNGARFRRALIAGSKRVISRHDYLNKINVFPVSDSDTGTNISLTLSAGLKSVALEPSEVLGDVLTAFADGTLESARGNSGTIFAQWFQGFTENCTDIDQIDTQQFIKLFDFAAAHAYKAVAEPVEGTVLTVLNETSEYLSRLKKVPGDFAALFDLLMKKANQSLADTPKKLKVLKKFGVVDAGAQALVDFFDGISQFIHQGDIKELDAEIAQIVETELEEMSTDHQHDHDIDDYTYRYCTECIIVGSNIDQDKLKQSIIGMGDSLVLAGSKRKTKIHMHVNEPAKLFQICRQFGKLHNEKVDDMFHQIKDAHAKHSDVAIVTDSAMDLPQFVLDNLNIHVIPIRIHVEDNAYIDGVSITRDEFYQMTEEQGVTARTAHPTYRDFKAKYQFLASHYKFIVSIHLSHFMSNTLNAAKLVADDMPNVKLSIIDSLSVSSGQGLLVQYAAEMANAGKAHDEIINKINELAKKLTIYTVIGNLDYAIRGGRLPKSVGRVAKWFKLTPVIQLSHDKKPKPISVIRGSSHKTRKFSDIVRSKIDPNKKYRIGVIHCQAEQEGQKLLQKLTLRSANIESSFLVNCTITLGAHSGPGTLGVALLEV